MALGLVAAAVPVFAHHSFAAEFDGNKQITLTGVVTKVDWVNPHAYIYVDVKGDDGAVVNWAHRNRCAQRALPSGLAEG